MADDSDKDFIELLKNNYGIDINISREYLEVKYQNLVESVQDLRYKTGIKHLLYYLVVKELNYFSTIPFFCIITINVIPNLFNIVNC